MGSLLAAREADDVALLQLVLAVGRAERRPPADDEQPLLVRMVRVVRPEPVARLELVQAPSDQLTADARADPGVLASPPCALLDAVPLVGVEIEDLLRRSLICTEPAERQLDRGLLGARDRLSLIG